MKRQLGIAPGKRKKGAVGIVFFLVDQVDQTIGIWAFLLFLISPPFTLIFYSFLLSLTLHLAVSITGYALGMRKTKT